MPAPRPEFSCDTANVFVRVPSHDERVAEFEGRNAGVSETASASHQHNPPPTSNGHPPLTPHKTQKMPSPPTTAHLPPTPDQTPTKPPLKRPLQSDPQTPSSTPLKRHRPNNLTTARLSPPPTSTPSPSPHHHHHRRFHLAPKFSILHQSHPLAQPLPHGDQHSTRKQKKKNKKERGSKGAVNVSWRELERVAESVMRQVDWEQVGEDVASNRRAGVYKRAVKDVFRERIEELVGGEEEEEVE